MRVLSFHREYACRHSGACCSAGWIEPLPTGICRHYDAHPSGGCTIHRASGHAALPHACQQFPRVATLSPLGVSVTLSAFCPTAASLLFDDGPFEIVTVPTARAFEGLDARNVMPPLLRDGMLMDWDAVARWEELAVETLSTHRHDVERAIEIIEHASATVCETWTPSTGPLADTLTRGFGDAGMSGVTPLKDRRRDRSVARPGGTTDIPASPASASATIARYLAAHAFACWEMYNGRGIRGALAHLGTVRETLDRHERDLPLLEAMRQGDLELRHRLSTEDRIQNTEVIRRAERA